MIVNRGAFKLTLYKNLKLAKSYGIAVGQVGLETPAGLYHVQNKAVNPAWTMPNSDWVAPGDRGKVVPGGTAENPLKARWLGIYAGAGIHGTDAEGSIGTAASHGCIRMRIPDVIDALRPGAGQRAGLHRVGRAISSTGHLLPALLQQGGVVVRSGECTGHRCTRLGPASASPRTRGWSRRACPGSGTTAAAACPAVTSPASSSWRRVAT